MTNRLAKETSPYLLQHAHNPVDWYPWGDEAFTRARAEDRPVMLSVGYSACHWCHVMERESFENEGIAAIMNEHFVNIKVDREERPDVDSIYMGAVQAMTGQGGWPMTVFMTPDGKPFYGGTYFPPEDRGGLPAFPRVLEAIASAYKNNRSQIVQTTEQLLAHMRQASSGMPAAMEPLTADVMNRAFAHLAAQFDGKHGGFGLQPKFPQPMTYEFLLRQHLRTGDPEPLEMVETTLDRMAMGGIYDQLRGGFHRYSVDTFWLVPHFEKMLYDNALLARLYLHAYQVTGKPTVQAGRRGDARLRAGRDDRHDRRLLLGAGRGQRGRGGQVLRMAARGGRRRAGGGRRRRVQPVLRRDGRRQLRGDEHPKRQVAPRRSSRPGMG